MQPDDPIFAFPSIDPHIAEIWIKRVIRASPHKLDLYLQLLVVLDMFVVANFKTVDAHALFRAIDLHLVPYTVLHLEGNIYKCQKWQLLPELEVHNRAPFNETIEFMDLDELDMLRHDNWSNLRELRRFGKELPIQAAIRTNDLQKLKQIVAFDEAEARKATFRAESFESGFAVIFFSEIRLNAVEFAAANNSFECFRFLLLNHFKLGVAIRYAVLCGNTEMIQLLLELDQTLENAFVAAAGGWQHYIIDWLTDVQDQDVRPHACRMIADYIKCTNIFGLLQLHQRNIDFTLDDLDNAVCAINAPVVSCLLQCGVIDYTKSDY